MIIPRTNSNGLAERTELRRALEWEGYGMVAPGVFAHPRAHPDAAGGILESLGISDKAVVLAARDLPGVGALPWRRWPRSAGTWGNWRTSIGSSSTSLRRWKKRWTPMRRNAAPAPAPAAAFAARMLLLHRWRRIVLHDPLLPAGMLAPDWPGHPARATVPPAVLGLVRRIRKRTCRRSPATAKPLPAAGSRSAAALRGTVAGRRRRRRPARAAARRRGAGTTPVIRRVKPSGNARGSA